MQISPVDDPFPFTLMDRTEHAQCTAVALYCVCVLPTIYVCEVSRAFGTLVLSYYCVNQIDMYISLRLPARVGSAPKEWVCRGLSVKLDSACKHKLTYLYTRE